jgi:hypothetical protein
MFGSAILDVAIGLVFIYLLLSLICSAAKEGLEALMKKRAIDLETGIKELLSDPDGTGLAKEVYEHPLIDGLFKGTYAGEKGGRFWSNLPAYIPAQNFVLALLDVISRGSSAAAASPITGQTVAPVPASSNLQASEPANPQAQAAGNQASQALQSLRTAISAMNNRRAREALLTLVDAAGGDMAKARANIEAWFNSSMDQVSGWYKRWSQAVIFVLGLLLVAALNVDTVEIGNSLARDPSLRQYLVAAAQESAKRQDQDAKGDTQRRVEANLEEMRKIGLPIGWSKTRIPSDWDASWVAVKIVGLLLTTLALSFGAPFWFDVLNKFMVVRAAVKPEEKSPKEKSKD